MANLIPGREMSVAPLLEKRVAMIGYGNQGRPQALNLRDSGISVVIGLPESSQRLSTAQDDGFEVFPTGAAVEQADFVMLCVPDQLMGQIYQESVQPNWKAEKILAFSHGFAIRFGFISPSADSDVILICPKGTGPMLRSEYLAGRGVPALVGIHQDVSEQAESLALAYAAGLGCNRKFAVRTTFADETEADLFGEQAILCGGIPELIKMGVETLIRKGIAPEVAYFECLQDAKTVLDLVYERGLQGMREAISDTAEWGGLSEGPNVVDEGVRSKMEAVLDRIQSGEFAQNWIAESEKGSPNLNELRQKESGHVLNGLFRELNPD